VRVDKGQETVAIGESKGPALTGQFDCAELADAPLPVGQHLSTCSCNGERSQSGLPGP